jgi:hypothetical protein
VESTLENWYREEENIRMDIKEVNSAVNLNGFR